MSDKKEPKYVTRQKFAEMCGKGKPVNRSTIATAISARNVIEEDVDGKNLIDVNHPTNAKYLKKRVALVTEQETDHAKTIEAQKREIDLKKATEDLRVKELTRQRMEKEAIPTKLIYPIYEQFFAEVFKQTHAELDKFIVQMMKKHQIPKVDQAKYKGDLIKLVNDVIKKTKQACVNETNTVISNYEGDT